MRIFSGKLKAILLLLVLILLSAPSKGLLLADTFTDNRIQVGLKLFRSLVSADLDIKQKLNANRELPVALVYVSSDSDARDLQQTLHDSFSTVKDVPVDVQVRNLSELIQDTGNKPVAIFIAQPLNESQLAALVKYGIERQVIVFSPFEGDVEKGVLGGLSVQATVRPLINVRTLNDSRIRIKPFYLKVAKHYE